MHEGVSDKRKRNDKASYRPDSIPELIHEQEASLHTGNDGSPGPASEGAAAKSDDRTTLTNRFSGDTKISPLTTQQQVGKPQYRRFNLRDWEKHPHEITTPSATHSFAMSPAIDSAHITITEYNVLGRQLMDGQGNRGHWWKSLTYYPDHQIAIVDPTDLNLLQKSNPQAAHGTSRELHEWLGIMGWNDFPIKVKYSKEDTAVLHQYTRGDSKIPWKYNSYSCQTAGFP